MIGVEIQRIANIIDCYSIDVQYDGGNKVTLLDAPNNRIRAYVTFPTNRQAEDYAGYLRALNSFSGQYTPEVANAEESASATFITMPGEDVTFSLPVEEEPGKPYDLLTGEGDYLGVIKLAGADFVKVIRLFEIIKRVQRSELSNEGNEIKVDLCCGNGGIKKAFARIACDSQEEADFVFDMIKNNVDAVEEPAESEG